MNTRTRSTLVLGDDGTPAADVAWLWINNHAWPGWRLEIITARQPPIGHVLPREQTEPHPWHPTHPRDPFAASQIDEVAHLIAEADPRLVLSRPVDLLVIGPSGPGLLKALHLGSTADWLLLRPPAPMVIVRHGHTSRNVVVCTDGSTHATRAIDVLCGLPWVGQLEITVLAVADGRADIDAATASAAHRLRACGATVVVETPAGKPTNVIIDRIEQTSPDLVVLGTKGLTGLPRRRVGSTAHRGGPRCQLLSARGQRRLLRSHRRIRPSETFGGAPPRQPGQPPGAGDRRRRVVRRSSCVLAGHSASTSRGVVGRLDAVLHAELSSARASRL